MIFIALILKHMVFLYIDQALTKIDKKGKTISFQSCRKLNIIDLFFFTFLLALCFLFRKHIELIECEELP